MSSWHLEPMLNKRKKVPSYNNRSETCTCKMIVYTLQNENGTQWWRFRNLEDCFPFQRVDCFRFQPLIFRWYPFQNAKGWCSTELPDCPSFWEGGSMDLPLHQSLMPIFPTEHCSLNSVLRDLGIKIMPCCKVGHIICPFLLNLPKFHAIARSTS